jgi:hypothetical protein
MPKEPPKLLTPKVLLASVRHAPSADPAAGQAGSKPPANGDSGTPSRSPLEAICDDLRANAQASANSQLGFHDARDAQVAALVKSAKVNGIAVSKLPRKWDWNSPNDVGGAEHRVFVDGPSNRYVKIAKPSFGIYPQATPKGEWGMRVATPLEYLQKLQGMKDQWGIDTEIHGVDLGYKDSQPQFITSQPNVQARTDANGDPVRLTQDQITEHMAANRFVQMPLTADGAASGETSSAYYRPKDNTLIADAHPGNVIEKPDGTPSSFDTIVMHPDAILRAVLERKLGIGARPAGGLDLLRAAMAKTFNASVTVAPE